jgi:hypothetical protein
MKEIDIATIRIIGGSYHHESKLSRINRAMKFQVHTALLLASTKIDIQQEDGHIDQRKVEILPVVLELD